MKREAAQIKSDITQNATLATDNDAKTKEGLANLEAQLISNGAATAELRKDVQAPVHGLSQHPNLTAGTGAASTATADSEIQSS